MREYPQFAIVDPESERGEWLDYKHSPGGESMIVQRLRQGGKVETGFDLLKGNAQGGRSGENLLLLAKRFKTLVLDDWVFGIVLITMNVVFVGFAWKVSGVAVNAIVHLVYEITGVALADSFSPDLSGSGNFDAYAKKE